MLGKKVLAWSLHPYTLPFQGVFWRQSQSPPSFSLQGISHLLGGKTGKWQDSKIHAGARSVNERLVESPRTHQL